MPEREQRVVLLDDVPEADASRHYLDQLANQVRSLYCVCFREMTGKTEYGTTRMKQWDGDPQGTTGRRSKNVWPKIAEAIVRCGADPFEYIRAQFFGMKRAGPPAPNTLHNEQAIATWELFRAQSRRTVTHRIESDLNQIKVRVLPFIVNLKWDHNKALDYALRDQSCGTSPLVRYCCAVEANLPVASQFRERALLQYMFQMSDYDDVLGAKIPLELKEEATSIRRQVVRQ